MIVVISSKTIHPDVENIEVHPTSEGKEIK